MNYTNNVIGTKTNWINNYSGWIDIYYKEDTHNKQEVAKLEKPTSPNFDSAEISYKGTYQPMSYGPKKTESPNIVDNYESFFGTIESEAKDSCIIKNLKITKIEYGLGLNAYGNLTKTAVNKNTSLDFLLDAAKEYAKIEDNQEFKYRPTEDGNFIDSISQLFYGKTRYQEDIDSLRKDIDILVRELASKIKKGENPDINELKSTITIAGEKVTTKQITEIQNNSTKFISSFEDVGYGSNSFAEFAKKGIAKGAAILYGNKLSGSLGKAYSDSFSKKADENLQKCLELSEKCSLKQWDMLPAKYGVQAYDIFSKIGEGVSFESLESEFSSLLESYRNAYTDKGIDTNYSMSDVKNFYNSIK